MIVANLPYIDRAELAGLGPDITEYEPRIALDGGDGGLELIDCLLGQVPACLEAPGLLLLEIDHRQADQVVCAVARRLPFAETSVIRDYAGLERVIRVELAHV